MPGRNSEGSTVRQVKICCLPVCGKWIRYPDCKKYNNGYDADDELLCRECRVVNGSRAAIKALKDRSCGSAGSDDLMLMADIYDLAIQALRKQVPMAARTVNSGEYRCPLCGSPVLHGYLYCHRCGQSLGWVEVARARYKEKIYEISRNKCRSSTRSD